jgi:phospholipid N-methyltransferase
MDAIHREARFFTVELNPAMIPVFRKRFPKVTIYNDSATKLPEILKKEGLPHVDAIISGLPWAAFPAGLQDELLDAIVQSLPEGGFFSTYGYVQGAILPGAKGFRKRLQKHFSKIEKTPVVWLNLPPAFVYNCKK